MKRKYNNILVVSLTCLIGLLGINLLEQDNDLKCNQGLTGMSLLANNQGPTSEIVEDSNPDGVTLLADNQGPTIEIVEDPNPDGVTLLANNQGPTIEIVEDPNPDGVTLLDMNPIIDTNLLDL